MTYIVGSWQLKPAAQGSQCLAQGSFISSNLWLYNFAECCCFMQMSGWAGAQNLHAESGKAIMYSGMTDCFRRTVQEEGVRALFKVIISPVMSQHTCQSLAYALLHYALCIGAFFDVA